MNDPSVVAVDDLLYMFYTLAGSGFTDSIGLATSVDGRSWSDRGDHRKNLCAKAANAATVFGPSPSPAWDSLLVGRPSVIHDGKRFHLWYDGRKDLPPGAPDPDAAKSDTSRRFVGYVISRDGVEWDKREKPVFGEDAGGIHVFKSGDDFAMVIESRDGTRWATSPDGITWKSQGILIQRMMTHPWPRYALCADRRDVLETVLRSGTSRGLEPEFNLWCSAQATRCFEYNQKMTRLG